MLGGVVIRIAVDEVVRACRVVRTVVLVVDRLGVVIDVVVAVPSHRVVVVDLQWCAEAKALMVALVELALVVMVIRGSPAVELGSTVTNRDSPECTVEGVVINEEDRLSCG